MPAVEDIVETELERVERWRTDELLRAGYVGARIYHLITNWEDPAIHAHWYGPFAVWEGRLGVWGGIALGVLVGAVIVRRSGNSVRLMMDACAPGLLLAQGIGRWGNYFNQELYGKETS